MAKLPPKPRNPVHEFFPVGADGQSPMNFVGPKQVEEGDKPEEIANKYSLKGEHDVVHTPNNKVIGPGLGETLTEKKDPSFHAPQTTQNTADTPSPAPAPQQGKKQPLSAKAQKVEDRQNWRTFKVAKKAYKKKEKEKSKKEIEKIREEGRDARRQIRQASDTPNNKIGGIGATSTKKKSFNPSDLIKKTKNKTPKVNLKGPMPEGVKNLIKKGKNHPTKKKS